MFDLVKDPNEMRNVYGDPRYADEQNRLLEKYRELRQRYEAPSYEEYAPKQFQKNALK